MSVLLQCEHCSDYLQVLPSGVAIACGCPGALHAAVADKARRVAWAVANADVQRSKRSNDRKPR